MITRLAQATMLLLLSASAAAAQVLVQGTVVNTDSARLRGARVEMTDSSGRVRHAATTDSSGNFLIRLSAPLVSSQWSVRAEMLGYQTTQTALEVEDRQVVEIVLAMAIAAIPIEPLRVTARSRYARSSRDEYYDRLERVRRMGGGTILDYDQLQRRLGSTIPNLVLEQYPGIRSCPPTFFIDGLRASADDVRTLSVTSLEGIEIYRTVAQVPVQYQNRGSCGVVLIWTQVGDRGEGSPLTWRRVLIALGLIGLGVLILR
jgi:hypothetical protein